MLVEGMLLGRTLVDRLPGRAATAERHWVRARVGTAESAKAESEALRLIARPSPDDS